MVSISKLLNGGFLLASQQIYSNVASPEQASVEQYNIIKFLGGQGPYIQHPGFGISTGIPDQCTLEQVQLFSRHGERYPSKKNGKLNAALMKKLQSYNGTYKGDLAFLNDYTYFVPDENLYEKETSPANSAGIFSGTNDALRHGATFRTKYNSLYDNSTSLPVFSSNSRRVYLTSNYFARGFLGEFFEEGKTVDFHILSEDEEMGANSLTPRKACNTYDKDTNSDIIEEYDLSFLNQTLDRLQESNPGLDLDTDDLLNIFSVIAFEINVRGLSPFANIFTNEEYIKYQYYNSIDNYYSNGPGYNLTRTIGSTLLNASLSLFKEEKPENKIWLNFAHDTDWEIFHSALGLVTPENDLPVDQVLFPNPYVHSQILPQGARLILEKYSCDGESYVRAVLNDAVYPFKNCSSGPGFSCKLDDYEQYIADRLDGVDYVEQCEIFSNVSQTVDFYWDYKDTTYDAKLLDK